MDILNQIELPRDEMPQKDPVEWWYWNGHLKTEDGREFAYMLALFKAGVFGLKDVYFAHWQMADVGAGKFQSWFKTFWRGLDEGSFAAGKFFAKVGNMLLVEKMGDGTYRIATPDFDLHLNSKKSPLLAGGTGFMDLKSSTTKCYSLTRLETAGELSIKGKRIPVTGLSWMDHQWSPLTFNTEHAWTWFCFQLDDGTDIMCFEHGKKDKTRLATVSRPDGKLEVFDDVRLEPTGETWTSPRSEAAYPTAWRVTIPKADIRLECRVRIQEQEMVHGPFRYWEGPVTVEGKLGDNKISGRGFLELNGVPGKTFSLMLKRSAAKG